MIHINLYAGFSSNKTDIARECAINSHVVEVVNNNKYEISSLLG
jgi:hypothetical protein